MKKILHMCQDIKEVATKKFKSATITFLLIMLVVNGFQRFFGSENMVLGIIIAPMMLILMGRDMTAHPVKHFFRQALLLCIMASAACFSMVVDLCQYFGQKKLKGYATFFNSISSFCCGVI